ncbi:hypothetical protein RHIZO_03941 [Rhizobiaceae bacterium]|nr:hypothetical protein RHIZO_03941 [Rhizobiaceae bacterium]
MMSLHPAERTLVMVTAALAAVDFTLLWWKGIAFGWGFFAFSLGFAALMLAIGQVYRRWRDSERIALVAHVLGLFIAYSLFGALFNIALLPRPGAPVDQSLVRFDAWLGYSWPAFCAWMAEYPAFNEIVRTAYKLTLVQLLAAFIVLGAVLDRHRLHTAALATVVASLVTIGLWAVFPSGGAAAFWTLDEEVTRIVRPIVGSAYGTELNRLFREGVSDLSALGVTGLIGFPSFHTVMALVSLAAVWPYRLLRLIALVPTALLVPGILIHGGHNLADMLAGIAITAAAWPLATRIVAVQERRMTGSGNAGFARQQRAAGA